MSTKRLDSFLQRVTASDRQRGSAGKRWAESMKKKLEATASSNHLMVPTINMNGTPKARLIDNLVDALEALRAAQKAVGETMPNGRDYHMQGPDAINRATAQHVNRIKMLEQIQSELTHIAESID